jgi:hypothetical protein
MVFALSVTCMAGLTAIAFLALIWRWEPVVKQSSLITGIVLIDEQSGNTEELGSAISSLAGQVLLSGGKPIILSYQHRPDEATKEASYLDKVDGTFPTLREAYPLIEWIQRRYGPIPIAVYSNKYPGWLSNSVPGDWPISWIDADSSEREQPALRVAHPQNVFINQPFSIKVTPPTVTGTHILKLFRDGTFVKAYPIDGLPRIDDIRFELVASEKGSSLFHLRLTDEKDTLRSGYTFPIRTLEKPLITYISPYGNASPLAKLLDKSGFETTHIPPAQLKDRKTLARLDEKNDLLILDSIPTPLFSKSLKQRLSSRVRESGCNLLFIPGSDIGKDARGMPLEEILPVIFGYRDPEDPGDSLAFVAIVDASMSMFYTAGGAAGHGAFDNNPTGPASKMQMAKKALENLSNAIPDSDRFGVLTVTSSPSWVVSPSGPRSREAEIDAISRIYAWGPGINLYSGLQSAFDEISVLDADLKHILIFLDTADVDEYQVADRGTVWELIRDLQEQRISVSLIGFGNSADDHIPQLNRFAEESGGYFYLSSDIGEIPGFGLTDLEQITGNLINYQAEKVKYFSSDFPGVDSLPDLQGQVVTTLKPGASLYAWSDRELPLFAAWNYGKGRVAVFNADSGLSLSRDWTSIGKSQPWLSFLAKIVEPETGGPNLFFSSGEHGGILFAGTDNSDPTGKLEAQVRLVDGTAHQLELHKVGVRRFAAPVETEPLPVRTLEVSYPDRSGEPAWSTLSLIPSPSITRSASMTAEFNPPNVESGEQIVNPFDPDLFRLLLLFVVLTMVIDELFRPPTHEE